MSTEEKKILNFPRVYGILYIDDFLSLTEKGAYMENERMDDLVREEIINEAEEMLTEHIEAFLELAK